MINIKNLFSIIFPLIWMNSADIENNYYEYSGEFNNEKGNIILFSETEIDNSDFHNSSYKSSGKFVPITGNIEQLKHYFDALKDVKIDKIRVAHYGDSIIWADVITPDLRYNLQKKFGGHGAGFLSICSDDIKAKKSTVHSFSDDWKWASLFTKNEDRLPIGIAGTVAVAGHSSTVQFKGGRYFPASNSFSEISIFYSMTNQNSVLKILSNSGEWETYPLPDERFVNKFELDLNGKNRKIDLEFDNCENSLFYGISLESGNGVYVDNFAFRGNSGVSLKNISKETIEEFSEYLNYKLFIIQFGVNVVAAGNVNYQWYEKKMVQVVKYLKKYYPEASFLLLSSGDLGKKKGSNFYTHPEIKKIVKVQKRIAEKSNIAFWNLFEAMGGENSIISWVNSSPPLAFKDFCHLTEDGGKIIADLLTDALDDAHQNYMAGNK